MFNQNINTNTQSVTLPKLLGQTHTNAGVTKGDTSVLASQKSKITFLGNHNPSQLGQKLIKNYAKLAVQKDWTIISNLSNGTSSLAHLTGLINRQKTIVTVPGNIDIPYPFDNQYLYALTLINHGCIISAQNDARFINTPEILTQDLLTVSLCDKVVFLEPALNQQFKQLTDFCYKNHIQTYCIKESNESRNQAFINHHAKIL